KVDHSSIQIDSLIIFAHSIHLYEIKNYNGDYYYEADKLYKKPNLEIMNPLHQISRTEPLLRKLLQKHGYHLPIKSFVIFINPEFTLYQAPRNIPIILPTQIKQHFKTIQQQTNKLTKKHTQLADKLISLHEP